MGGSAPSTRGNCAGRRPKPQPLWSVLRRGWRRWNSWRGVRPNSVICTRRASRRFGSVSISSCCSALYRHRRNPLTLTIVLENKSGGGELMRSRYHDKQRQSGLLYHLQAQGLARVRLLLHVQLLQRTVPPNDYPLLVKSMIRMMMCQLPCWRVLWQHQIQHDRVQTLSARRCGSVSIFSCCSALYRHRTTQWQ
jgi:hypothetical protein